MHELRAPVRQIACMQGLFKEGRLHSYYSPMLDLRKIATVAALGVFILGAFILLMLALFRNDEPTTNSHTVNGTQYIVPAAGGDISLSDRPRTVVSIQDREETPQPKVQLSQEYVVSQIINANLDLDQMDEQIIVYKHRDDSSDRIRLLVAAFDGIRGSYIPVWEGVTRANNIRTFAIYSKDLTGDHNPEVVAFGTDNRGNQTLDVFRRSSPPSGSHLYFESILSISADASIEIEEMERSDAYNNAQALGAAFPVALYRRNEDGDNPLDLIKTTYYYHPGQGDFIAGADEEIPGTGIEEAQLAALYDAEIDVIHEFLSGPWFRETGPAANGELVFFDPVRESIVFYRGDTQESYLWMNSYKTIYRTGPGLWVNVRNESIQTVRRQASIAISSIDSLTIDLEGTDIWDGTYRRLTPGLQQSLLRRGGSVARGIENVPEGLFRADSGEEIFFASPNFIIRQGDSEYSGAFTLYELGSPVLQLEMINRNGLVTKRETYRYEYGETRSDDRTVRRIELTPARLQVDGLVSLESDTRRFEQIEIHEDEE